MGQETIEDILRRKQAEKAEAAGAAETGNQEDKFFSVIIGEGLQESFLELRTRDGLRTCFSYSDIIWIVFDPENGLSIEFGGYLVSIEGRGLAAKLFEGIKQKRVAWVKEADHEMQDHKDNDLFVSKIMIIPPKGFADGDSAPE